MSKSLHPKPSYRVALAILRRNGLWLVARRHDHVHLGGMWEFPGGKCESNESPSDAAIRELREECGVEATADRELDAVPCDYGDRTVILIPVLCRWRAGEPTPLASQECRWVRRDEFRALEMPTVNSEILRAVEQADQK